MFLQHQSLYVLYQLYHQISNIEEISIDIDNARKLATVIDKVLLKYKNNIIDIKKLYNKIKGARDWDIYETKQNK